GWPPPRRAARRYEWIARRCSRARVRYAAQKPRALARCAPPCREGARDGRLRRGGSGDQYNNYGLSKLRFVEKIGAGHQLPEYRRMTTTHRDLVSIAVLESRIWRKVTEILE